MILQHRIPPSILPLLFSSEYSSECSYESKWGDIHQHFECPLTIDDQSYVLEATIDADKRLYHLHARRVQNCAQIFAKKTFPMEMTPRADFSSDSEPIGLTDIEVDRHGNVSTIFDGHRYTIFAKKKRFIRGMRT